MSSENQEQNNPELNNNQDLEEKVIQKKDLIEKLESDIDWNLISIFSIWIFLSFTFFCIFVKY